MFEHAKCRLSNLEHSARRLPDTLATRQFQLSLMGAHRDLSHGMLSLAFEKLSRYERELAELEAQAVAA